MKKPQKHYIDIDNSVLSYQKEQNQKDSEYLIENYKGFLYKFAVILSCTDKSLNNMEKSLAVHQFICLFGPLSNFVSARKSITNNSDKEEIYNQLVIIFLTVCLKWEKREGGPHFAGFINVYFKFIVKKWVDSLSKDIINNSSILCYDMANLDEVIADTTNEYNLDGSKAPINPDDEYFDISNPIFNCLTKLEINVIKEKSVNSLSYAAIAKKYNVDVNMIPKAKKSAITKIAINMLDNEELEDTLNSVDLEKILSSITL